MTVCCSRGAERLEAGSTNDAGTNVAVVNKTDVINNFIHEDDQVTVIQQRVITARIRQQLDVFHQRDLRKILGITWKDRVTGAKLDWAAKITGHCSRETT